MEKENNKLISKSYQTNQKRSDFESWKSTKEKELVSLSQSLQSVIADLRDKEMEIVKLKSEKKMILDSSIKLKKESDRLKASVGVLPSLCEY